MNTAIWQFTILLEFAILTGLWWRRYWVSIPIFTATIAFCAVQSIPLSIILRHGTKLDYYYAYYAIDLMTVACYILSAVQCWRYLRFRVLSLTMAIWLLAKAPVYVLISTGHRRVAGLYLGDLRFANIACYFVWAFVVWRYDERVTQSTTRLCDESRTQAPSR